MPESGKAKSISQQRLMGMAYACKKGDIDCDGEPAKLAKSMTLASLRRFAKTKHRGLPYKINKNEETMVFDIEKEDSTELTEWLQQHDITYSFLSEHRIIIDGNAILDENEQYEFDSLLDNLNMRLIENVVFLENLATLATTVGLGAVNPPSPSTSPAQPGNGRVGSGDRFDNKNDDDDDDDDDDKKPFKKRKHHKIKNFSEIVKKKTE